MQLYETADNPAPKGADVYAAHTRDNFRIRALTAPALTTRERGTILFLNGRGEFMERYFETMAQFQARGFHVAAMDWRGQGGSQRLLKDTLRGHIRSYREYDEDLRAVMEGVVTKNCPAPYYAVAHSTGGHILLRNLARKTWFKKAIVTAPLMELQYGTWPKSIAYFTGILAAAFGLGSRYLPGFGSAPFLLRGFENNILTSDPKRWKRDRSTLEKHPTLGVGGPTYAWLVATMTSLKQIHSSRKGEGLNCPLLMILAGRERVVDNKAAHRYVANMPGVSVVTIAQSLHEIMMEQDPIRREFFAAVESYLGDTE
jgi:lysophospholipase